MIQLQLVKSATISAGPDPSPGEIVYPDQIHDDSLIQIVIEGGFSADLDCRAVADPTAPSIRVHDAPAHDHDHDHLLWQGRAKFAPRFLYAAAPVNVTYTIALCGKD